MSVVVCAASISLVASLWNEAAIRPEPHLVLKSGLIKAEPPTARVNEPVKVTFTALNRDAQPATVYSIFAAARGPDADPHDDGSSVVDFPDRFGVYLPPNETGGFEYSVEQAFTVEGDVLIWAAWSPRKDEYRQFEPHKPIKIRIMP
ncbi:MAG: hypothetical protein U0821_04355 [Chloroflexota bacterium]